MSLNCYTPVGGDLLGPVDPRSSARQPNSLATGDRMVVIRELDPSRRRPVRNTADLPFFQKTLAEQFKQDPRGQWLAVDGDRIVARSDSLEEVVWMAFEKGVTDPEVFRGPIRPWCRRS